MGISKSSYLKGLQCHKALWLSKHKKHLASEARGWVLVGFDAMAIFANLHLEKDAGKVAEIRQDLLKYCNLDTLAMVRIWQKLAQMQRI